MKKTQKHRQTSFEWIQLFISVTIPISIAVYTILENDRELSIATSNRAQDLEMADNLQKDTSLWDYQKSSSKLIETYGPEFNEYSSVSLVARFATLSALNQIDHQRRNVLIRLLYDAKLITYDFVSDKPSISLEAANLVELCLLDGTFGQTMSHFSVAGAIMIKADFRGMNIHGAIFNRAKLNSAEFSSSANSWYCSDIKCIGPESASLYFEESDLTSASFAHAIYDNASFESAQMSRTNLSFLRCDSCSFLLANMTYTHLRHAEAEQSSFVMCEFMNAEIHHSLFVNVDFSNSDMSHAYVTYNNLTKCQFESTQWRNATFDYNTIENSSFKGAKMSQSSMLYNNFSDVDFSNAEIISGNWQYVRCERCLFKFAVFNDTNLRNSVFIESDFRNAMISEDQLNQISLLKDTMMPVKL